LTPWDRPAEQLLPQGVTFEQLGNDVGLTIVHPDVVDGNDVGMAEGGGGTGLLLETAQAVLIMGESRLEYLEGDVPLQPLVAGAVYFPHPSRAYLLQNSIVTQYFTNHAKLKRRVTAS